MEVRILGKTASGSNFNQLYLRPVLTGLEEFFGCIPGGEIILSVPKSSPTEFFKFNATYAVTLGAEEQIHVVYDYADPQYFCAFPIQYTNKMIKAKFKVLSITERIDNSKEVKLQPVVSGSEENKSFSTYTPTGELSMVITNPTALDFFKIGKEYYLDFTAAE